MSSKKIFGIVLIVIGGFMLFFSDYIAQQVAEGRMQIEQGQRTIDTTKSVFESNQYSKPFGDMITSPGQKRIDAGKMEVSRYESLSNTLRIVGIVFIILGVGIVFFWKKRA